MFCQKFLALLTLSLSIAPAVLAVPSWSIDYVENPLKNHSPQVPTHNNGGNSGGSKSNHPSTGSHHGHHSTTNHGDAPAKVKVNGRGNICGSIVSKKQASSHEKKLKSARVAPSTARAGPVNFDVYWHVIQEDETKAGGYVSKEDIDAQLKVLDASFDIANFDFTLKNVTYTTNPEWFKAAWFKDPDLEFTIKSSLRQGDAAAINIYTTNPGDGLLGYAYFPFMYEDAPDVDGVVIHWGSLPGGHLEDYDGGMTLVHELGHWLGLYHTFQGESCKGPGDYVSDTPQQAVQSNSCTPSDSCADLPGGDPYTNFMDYSPDACLSEFTTGQIRRMRDEIRTYRGVANA